MKEAKLLAENAVKDGDNTLKKANHTYHLLQSFQSEVEKSSETAKVALEKVDDIVQKIQKTETLISEAENVSSYEIIKVMKGFKNISFLRHSSYLIRMQMMPNKTLKMLKIS